MEGKNPMPQKSDFQGREMPIIRKAKHNDVGTICSLWREFMDFHEQYDPFYKRSWNGHKLFYKFVDEQISARNALVLVAEQDSDLCAYLLARIDNRPPVFDNRRHGSIYDLAVSASYRPTPFPRGRRFRSVPASFPF